MIHQALSCAGLVLLASASFTQAQSGPGNALRFDGTDDFVEIPSSPLLNRTTLTVMAWIKPDTLLSNQVLVSKMNVGGTNGWALVQEGAYVRGEAWFATSSGNVSVKLATELDNNQPHQQLWKSCPGELVHTRRFRRRRRLRCDRNPG